jgi:FAD/FMN-containing dehydrogenase
VATGRAGPYVARYGRLQDFLTGVKLGLTSGEVVSFGIPCVKNVAGYALERLVVGSRGTLCAILELTLRTLPLPERELTLAVPLRDLAQAEALLARLSARGTRPAAVAIADQAGECVALAALHGLAAEVAALEQTVHQLAADLDTAAAALPAAQAAELWGQIAEREASPVPPSDEGDWPQRLKAFFDPAGILPEM